MTSREKVRDFLEHEADLLDRKLFREWLALFAADAWYWIPVAADQISPTDGPSHIHEMRPLLEARVERLMAARLIPQSPPSRTCRVVSGVRIVDRSDAVTTAQASFIVVEARTLHEADDEDEKRIIAGHATYGLVTGDNDLRIAWKRVDLVDSEGGLRGITIPM